jgi:hypothetical protein
LALLLALGGWTVTRPTGGAAPAQGSSDLALYKTIVDQVRAGQPYEAAAVAAHRAGHYPLHPFIVVRPPLLANLLARFPSVTVADGVLTVLGLGVLVVWGNRFRHQYRGRVPWAAAVLVLFTGVTSCLIGGGASLFHETWTGLLLALSLALRTERRYVASVTVALLAALIRELAMPFLAVMSLVAFMEGRRWEGAAFGLALIAALAALAAHAAALTPLVSPADLSSPGWTEFGGWKFVLSTHRWNLLSLLAGPWAAAVFAPLALIGAMGWRNPTGLRLALILTGYTLGFMFIGRAENSYWGLITAPMVAVALVFAIPALKDLWRRAVSPWG